MLCGKPVINTALETGVPWVSLHGETGLTVPPGDPIALATAINLLLENTEMRRQFGEKARERARAMFTLEHQLRTTQEHYASLLSRKRSPLALEANAIRPTTGIR
jgi:rhamnosyl/mannosyltransferase